MAALLMLMPVTARDVSATPDWQPCEAGDPMVECAVLDVPLDHADPGSRKVGLPLRRLPAHDPAARIGTLVTIAGGPGQRGTDLVRPGFHSDAIAEHFDIVSWDPRGTSGETRIDCIPDWDPYDGLDRTPDSAAEQEALDARTASLAAGCREAHRGLLPFVGTLQTTLDLEHLRAALGERRISLLGLSYGSQVALTYATLFPERVRAVVVDGASAPGRDPARREVEQAAAFEAQLDRLLGECDADGSCPLGTGGQPGAALDRLLARLDAEPLETDGQRLTQSDAYEAIVGSLVRDARARQALLDGLAAAVRGDGMPLLGIAAEVRRAYEDSGLTQGAFMAITCADTIAFWRSLSPADVATLTARIHAAAPRLGPWLWSPPSLPGLPPLGLCAMQATEPPTLEGPIDAAGAGPVLVLATSGDPATPASSARRASVELDEAVLVTLEADHHLAYPHAVAEPERHAYRCVLDAVEAYLIHLQPPGGDVHCGPHVR